MKHSLENGMGPIPTHASPPNSEVNGFDMEKYLKAKELCSLLDELTLVEEAAICQITLLMPLTCIRHGSMRVKGNMSCVWQQSKIHVLLPNLPTQIYYIFIVCSATRGGHSLKSTRARRGLIQRVLELLRACDVKGVWAHIIICPDRLAQWPEDNDIVSLPGAPIVREIDENSDPVDKDSNPDQPGPHHQCPGNLVGPAALQNDAHVEQEYKAFNTRRDNNISSHANVELTTRAVSEFSHNLRHPNPNPLDVVLCPDSATYQQPQVMHTDGFVDMDKAKYS